MPPETSAIAVCGLDCAECDIFQAARDPALAERLVERFKARGRTDATPAWFQCQGCRGDRARCWSDDCWIWQCCVAGRQLDSCARCADFPCSKLAGWAAGSARYTRALECLRALARSS